MTQCPMPKVADIRLALIKPIMDRQVVLNSTAPLLHAAECVVILRRPFRLVKVGLATFAVMEVETDV